MASDQRDIAVVTGANRGIGLETCRQLAAHGLHIVLTGRDEAQARRAANELEGNGRDVATHQLDVTDERSIGALAGDLERDHGRIDVLVNNAGVIMEGFNSEVARRTIDTNCLGPMKVTDRLLPLISAHGRIVMVSSGMGQLACVSSALRKKFMDPALTRDALVELMGSFVADVASGQHEKNGWPTSAYRVSKVGLNAYTRILARELADRRLRLNAVCPGWVRTDMGGASAVRSVEEGADTPVWAALLPENGPTGGFFRDRKTLEW